MNRYRLTSWTLVGIACIATARLALFDHPAPAAAAAVPDGRALYNDKCAMCHDVSGKGIPGTFPPLAGNAHVIVKDPSALVREILDGMPITDITVNGRHYGGGMPAWGNWLSNAETAAIATYVRNAWGNHAPAVTEAEVAQLRK